MTPARWQTVRRLFERAVEWPESERGTRLDSACDGDAVLRHEVERLLASESEVGAFLEHPAAVLADISAGPADEPDLTGSRLGAYRVEAEIGRGGMGVVYQAVRADQRFDRRVAIKVVKRGLDTNEVLRRFRLERTILGRLDHPNIAQILDAGATPDGRPFLVMELVEGRPLDCYCDEQDLDIRHRICLLEVVCHAVHHAHRNLIAHRDLKPRNVLITAAGVPKLLDFGVAKMLDPETSSETCVMARRLTPEYASPEQRSGGPVTAASDVYSLGVMLYELLTGERPFRASDLLAADGASLGRLAVPRPSRAPGLHAKARRALRGDLDRIVSQAMAPDPADRYASVERLADDLARHLGGRPVRAREPTLGYRLGRFVLRNKVVTTFSLLILAAALVMAAQSVRLGRALDETRVALDEAEIAERHAQAANDFLFGFFRDANPRGTRGPGVTLIDAMDAGAARVGAELADQPLVEATVLGAIGRVNLDIGQLDRARAQLERALALRRAHLEAPHGDLATSLDHLGKLYRDLPNYEAAEPLIRGALAMRRRLARDDPRAGDRLAMAESLTNLGHLLGVTGRLDDALAALEEALALRRAALGEADPRVVDSRGNLATAFMHGRRYAAALPLLEQVVADYQARPGTPHPNLGVHLVNLGQALCATGRIEDGERRFEGGLDMLRAHGSPNDVSSSLYAFALRLWRMGELDRAEPWARQALGFDTERLGPDHEVATRNRALLEQIVAGETPSGWRPPGSGRRTTPFPRRL